jgi:DNA-directed RNA polymerase subunit RPC12/RpoP
VSPELELLRCGECATPVALADADTVKCPGCGAAVAVPAAHRAAFENARRETETRAEARALYAKLGAPPRALRVVGVVFDPGEALRAKGKASRNGLVKLVAAYYGTFAIVAGPALFLLAFLVGEVLLMRVIGNAYHVNPMDTLSNATRDWISLPGAFAALIAGTALGVYGRRRALSRHRLQASLAARPPSREGGPRECRQCGAPLSIPDDALGVRCIYCGADNLVRLPAAWLADVGRDVAQVAGAIEEANGALVAERRRLRRKMLWAVGITVSVIAIFVGIELAAGTDSRPDDNVPPSWPAYATDPRPLVRRDLGPPDKLDKRVMSSRVSAIAFKAACPAGAQPLPVGLGDCDTHGCTVRLYAALRHGDHATLALGGMPAGTHVAVERHSWYVWPEEPGGSFGPAVDATSDEKGMTFTATWSAWHELAITMPAAPSAATVCFAVAP